MQSSHSQSSAPKPVQLVTLDPGHFHAALVQKTMYEDVDSIVQVYAPPGKDLQLHIDKINTYNSRNESPTHWKEEVYAGSDFFKKMMTEKKGNVVVLSGNNQKKSDYILQSLQNGFHVLADKPMAINSKDFETLKQAFVTAGQKKLTLYDIMTERFEIATILQRELSMTPEIFGTLEKGTAANPAVVKESVHYFYKYVSGSVLTRPAWFFDAAQQGEAIADVATHLVDLVQWECFPEQTIDYKKDIQVNTARHWPSTISLSQFQTLTGLIRFPDYLKQYQTNDTAIKILYNGAIGYTLKGIHAQVTAKWDYAAAPGSGDTYYSLMRGTKASLVIRQMAEQQYKPTLYIEPVIDDSTHRKDIQYQFDLFKAKHTPGIGLKESTYGWEVTIPDKYKESHEEHFARVTQYFLEYLKHKNMPAWEVPNMLAKYYVTTKALAIAINTKQ